MFTTKYKPNKLTDFIGNEQIIHPFTKWLLTWDQTDKKNKCALVSGLNGIGKSLLVELLLNKFCHHAIHLSIDDERDKEEIQKTIKPLLHMKKTFDDKENVLVVSDIDSSGGDYGFIAGLVECIKETEIPIICICDDRYSQNLKPIMSYCFNVVLKKPTFVEVYPLIYKVVTEEKIKINKREVDKLYEQSNGDIRYILNQLQMGLRTSNDNRNHKDIQSSNIFDTTGRLFNMDAEITDKYLLYWSAADIHTLMVHENYIGCIMGGQNEVKRTQNLAHSSSALSDTDIIDSVFNFELEPYVAMNTIRVTEKCNKKGHIKFPQFLGKTSIRNKNKREKLDYTKVKFTHLKSK
jgi:replication factor C subunit 1